VNQTVSDSIREIEKAARHFSFVRTVERVDETRYSVKYRLAISPSLFVQVYFNVQNGTAPVYYQNYLLGEMNCSQLTEHILTHVVDGDADRFVSDPAVGHFLIDRFFRIGARYPWNEALQHATGETLRPEYFAKHLQ